MVVEVFEAVDYGYWLVVDESGMVCGFAAGVKYEFFCSTDVKEKVDVCAPVCEMWDSLLVGCVGSHDSELH